MLDDLSSRPIYEHAEHAARIIRSQYSEEVRVALVLGSGLGAFADEIQESTAIPYEEIQGFARSTVEGHAGRLVLGKIKGVSVAVMQGRFHYYEGYALEEVVFPIRTLGLLGVESLILTNAAEIGRASCRERVEIWGGDVCVEEK